MDLFSSVTKRLFNNIFRLTLRLSGVQRKYFLPMQICCYLLKILKTLTIIFAYSLMSFDDIGQQTNVACTRNILRVLLSHSMQQKDKPGTNKNSLSQNHTKAAHQITCDYNANIARSPLKISGHYRKNPGSGAHFYLSLVQDF